MPRVSFEQLPDSARVWVFGCDRPLHQEAPVLLAEVDAFLDQWAAHGKPLRCGRDWKEERFLAIGVDPTHEQASGCSIDGLFQRLKAMEGRLGTTMLSGGRIFYRDSKGRVQMAFRNEMRKLADAGAVSTGSAVFDTTVTDARAYRTRFERPARDTWVGALLDPQDSQPSSRSATNSSSVRNG